MYTTIQPQVDNTTNSIELTIMFQIVSNVGNYRGPSTNTTCKRVVLPTHVI